MDLARALEWLPREQYVVSPCAKPEALTAWHRPDYIAALVQAERDQRVSDTDRARYHIGTPSNPVFPEMYRRPATAAGASLLAGELLAQGGVVYSPAGGTHHGLPGRANGFCYLNDPVLAILSLRRNGAKRIAYVDIDAHHPDGVVHGFGDDPDVLLISTHEVNRWPRTGAIDEIGAGNVFNLPLQRGAGDGDMALALDQLILPAITDFGADAIVLQCGADAVEEDPQSNLSMSNNAHFAVVQALGPLTQRFLVLGGGGYNPWSVGRLWTGVWGLLNGREPLAILPRAAQDVLAQLEWEGHSRARNRPAHWVTDLRDAVQSDTVMDQTRSDVARLAARLKTVV